VEERPSGFRPLRDTQWWRYRESGRAPHEAIDSIIRRIRMEQGSRYEAYRRWAESYGANISSFGLSPTYRALFSEDDFHVNDLANTVDTLVSQVFKNRIVPAAHSVGGDWEERERAEMLGRWLDGIWQEAHIHDDAIPKAGLAAFIFGTGPIKVSHEVLDEAKKEAAIVVEYAPTPLCYVDEVEGRFGKPPSFYQEHCLDRFHSLARWAAEDDDDPHLYGTREERERAILEATHTANDASWAYGNEGDQIIIREAWHRPSYAGADDGLYVVSINACTLYVRPWKRKRFPFAWIRHGIPLGDFWGQSLVQRLEPLQKAQDRMDRVIDEAMHMMSVPRFLKRKNCGMSLDHIDDVPFAILETNDPQSDIREFNAQPVHPDMYAHRDSMANRMRGIAGVSAYSAQGMIPAGLRNASGKALEAFEDTENARHAMLHRSYEAAIVELAEIIIDEAEELEELGYTVSAFSDKKGDRQILSFREVKMDRKAYRLRLPPISQLARSFSARLEQVETLAKNQWVRPTTARSMLGNPDVEAENEISAADEDIILKNFHSMIKTGEALTPLSVDNLDLIVELSGKFINWCRLRSVPSERWALVAQYADEAIRLKAMAGTPPTQPPAAPSPAPAAGMPPAAPTTSDPMAMPPGPMPMGTA
jgi:hypothetical protein